VRSDAEQDRILWVQALYRATGQSHKPVPPSTEVQTVGAGKQGQLDAPISQYCESWIRAQCVPDRSKTTLTQT